MDQTPEERLLEGAKTPEDAEALARFDDRMALPLVLSAVLPLFLLPSGKHSLIGAAVGIVSWIVFLVDFTVHQRRLTNYLGTWLGRFDLVVVILTAPWFLLPGAQAGRFVMLIRLARLARLIMAGAGARRLFQRVGRIALVALAIVLIGAAAAYGAEHATNPEFDTYGNAVWWAIVTLTTVGYGDITPITHAGRMVAVMIMVSGVGVLGVLAGSLASFFRVGSPEDEDPATVLANEVVSLRRQVEVLTAQLATIVPPATGGGEVVGATEGDGEGPST